MKATKQHGGLYTFLAKYASKGVDDRKLSPEIEEMLKQATKAKRMKNVRIKWVKVKRPAGEPRWAV